MNNQTNNNNNGLLTKKQYLITNQANFAGLTAKEKEAKYQSYLRKYQTKNKSMVVANKVNRQIIVRPKNSPNNNNSRNANIVAGAKTFVRGNDKLNFKLSKCLLAYAKAAIDPFDNITDLPCIPDNITVPSNKVKTYLEADIGIGANGTGFAVMSPWKMLINDNTTNGTTITDYPVVTSTTNYATPGYSFVPASFALNNVAGWNPQSIYTTASMNNANTPVWRLVAAGMEIDYTGQLLNQSGMISVIQWDGMQNIPTGTTFQVIRQHPRSQTCATSREARCYVRFEPTGPSDYEYQPYVSYYPPARTQYYPLGIFVSGATANTNFRIRAVAYFEIQSLNLPVSPSEADPIGFPALQAARSEVLPSSDPGSDLTNILKRTATNILSTVSGYAPVIGTAIGSMFGQPALGTAVGGLSKDLITSLF